MVDRRQFWEEASKRSLIVSRSPWPRGGEAPKTPEYAGSDELDGSSWQEVFRDRWGIPCRCRGSVVAKRGVVFSIFSILVSGWDLRSNFISNDILLATLGLSSWFFNTFPAWHPKKLWELSSCRHSGNAHLPGYGISMFFASRRPQLPHFEVGSNLFPPQVLVYRIWQSGIHGEYE